jgi:hypothetical protein
MKQINAFIYMLLLSLNIFHNNHNLLFKKQEIVNLLTSFSFYIISSYILDRVKRSFPFKFPHHTTNAQSDLRLHAGTPRSGVEWSF